MSKLHFCARKINQRNLKEHRLSGFFSPRRLFRFLYLFSLLLSQTQSIQRMWELEMAPRESLQLYSTIAHERCSMKILPDENNSRGKCCRLKMLLDENIALELFLGSRLDLSHQGSVRWCQEILFSQS